MTGGTLELLAATAAVVAAIGALIAATVKTWQFVRRIVRFLDVFLGEPAALGEPAKPGIPERLAVVETRTAQLVNNGGASVKDAVDRIDTALADHIAQCPPPRRWRRSKEI